MPARLCFGFALLALVLVSACGGATEDTGNVPPEGQPAEGDEQDVTHATCATKRCAAGKRCIMDNVKCKRAPCPPVAICIE